MLAGNADRDRALDVLKAAYAEGRLTKDEYDCRMQRALAAPTIEELQQLTGDVPTEPSALPPTFQRPSVQGQLVSPQSQPVGPDAFPRRQNSKATAALVCGVGTLVLSGSMVTLWGGSAPFLFWIGAVPGIFLGYKARAEIRGTGEKGVGAATAGIVLGSTSILLGILMVIFLF